MLGKTLSSKLIATSQVYHTPTIMNNTFETLIENQLFKIRQSDELFKNINMDFDFSDAIKAIENNDRKYCNLPYRSDCDAFI